MPKPRQMSDEDEIKLTKMYGQGTKTGDLAALFGIHKTQVARVVQRRGGAVRAKGPKRLSMEDEKRLAARYEAGETVAALAREFGMHAATVPYVAVRHGVTVRPQRRPQRQFSDAEVAEMARLWHEEGLSQTAIAARFNTAQIVVSRVLRANGIEPVARWNNRRGANHGSWRGGRVVRDDGYVLVGLDPDDEMAAMRNRMGYVPEHRLVMARAMGRALTENETVHHVNGDKADNQIENLQLRQGRHGKGVVMRCRCCGSTDIESVPIAESED